MHTNGFVHADLALRNILYEEKRRGIHVALGDFGLAHQMKDEVASQFAWRLASPELIQSRMYVGFIHSVLFVL